MTNEPIKFTLKSPFAKTVLSLNLSSGTPIENAINSVQEDVTIALEDKELILRYLHRRLGEEERRRERQ